MIYLGNEAVHLLTKGKGAERKRMGTRRRGIVIHQTYIEIANRRAYGRK